MRHSLCALGKTDKTGLQIVKILRFYKPKFLHLLIPREVLTSLMAAFALAIEEKTTIKSQNEVTMLQTSKALLSDT